MASFNKVILAGNLTRDPQMQTLPSGTSVTDIGLAVNRRYRTQDGQQREEVCFIDCRAFGRQAEVLKQYMAKGRPILIEGRLHLDTWEGKDGQKHSRHRVVIENFQFLGQGGGGQGGPGSQGGYQQGGGYSQAPQGGGYQQRSAPQRPPQRQPGPPAQPESQPPPAQEPQDFPGSDDYGDDFAPPEGENIPF